MVRNVIISDRDAVLIHAHHSKKGGRYFNKSRWHLDIIGGVHEGVDHLIAIKADMYIVTNQAWLVEKPCEKKYKKCYDAQKALIHKLDPDGVLIKGFEVTEVVDLGISRAEAKAEVIKGWQGTYEHGCTFWMIGDSKADIDAGKMAGCNTIHVKQKYDFDPDERIDADYTVNSFYEATRVILEDGIYIIQKPIVFDPVKIEVVLCDTPYTDMTGEHIIKAGDYRVIHDDGSISGIDRESVRNTFEMVVK